MKGFVSSSSSSSSRSSSSSSSSSCCCCTSSSSSDCTSHLTGSFVPMLVDFGPMVRSFGLIGQNS